MLPALRERCKAIGRRGFARLAGINDGHLGRILAGTYQPSAATLAKLAKALRAGPATVAGISAHANLRTIQPNTSGEPGTANATQG